MKQLNKVTTSLLEYLDSYFPNAQCELHYTRDYEFLIAVMLSAQTTDKKVNSITDVLFKSYPNIRSLNSLSIQQYETILKPLGLYKNKAKNLKELVNILETKYSSKVPPSKKEIMSLPGVGNKTASLVYGQLFNKEEFPVDTHILRISKRLSFIKENDDVKDAETALKNNIPSSRWMKTHHQLIHFGRYVCKAIHPECEKCKLHEFCRQNPHEFK